MQTVRYCVLAAVVVTAVCTDVRFRRIPNWLTVSAAAVGLLLSVFAGGVGSSLKGLLIGFAVGYLLWMLGTFRAGDANLFAALGALMGRPWLIRCAAWSFVGGAVLGFGLLLIKKAPPVPAAPKGNVLAMISGAALIGGLSYLLQLVGARDLPASVLYPMITGGSIIFSTLSGMVFFKERPQRKQLLGILACFLGTLFFL